MMRSLLRFPEPAMKFFVLAFTLLLSSLVCAQIDTGSIVGVVRDPSGAVIPRATVTLTSKTTGVARTVTTNDDGSYQFAAITPGEYSVQASSTNFEFGDQQQRAN